MKTIQVDVADFAKTHRGLIRLLQAINQAGGSIQTRILLQSINSSTHGQRLIKDAERFGLIRREQREPEGGGSHPVYNILTKEGKELLKSVKEAKRRNPALLSSK